MKKNEKNKLIKSYAEAFYEASATSSLSEKVFAETEDFVDFLEKDTKLMKYLSGPLLKDSDKKEILVDITEKKNFSQPIVGLVKTMADNGRVALLPEVLKAYADVYYAKNNISQVNVQTAIELSEEQKNNLVSAMESYLGNKVVVKYQIKPEILGGLVIECGTKLIDDSIKGKLERLELLMKGTK